MVLAVIQYKWETYAKREFLRTLILDVAMVLTLTLDVLLSTSKHKYLSIATGSITIGLTLYFVMLEVKQFLKAKR